MTWERYVCVSAGTDGLIDWPSSISECRHRYELERDYLIYNLLLKYLIKIFWRQDLNLCRTMNYSYKFIVFLFICLVILLFSFILFLIICLLIYIYVFIYVYIYRYCHYWIFITIVSDFLMLFYFQVVPLIVYISRKTNKKKTEKQGKCTLSLSCVKRSSKKLGLSSSDFFLYNDEKEGDDIDVGSSHSSSRSFFLSLSVFEYSWETVFRSFTIFHFRFSEFFSISILYSWGTIFWTLVSVLNFRFVLL